ncbi:hypothetical protein MKZ24_20740 [Paenibacillus sp. FSL R7-0297]|uniref:hypothetical protein n=1 Tax=unclassified Paenibacillus TaxID=185978 RepID=UPI0004F8A9A1|nr:hypothetical protein [Paenibacillus sp. FSL R5-0912]AIQ41688.1 hypothetical protein R50912_17810 [Paenibacillus sp. FSL R5-0912]
MSKAKELLAYDQYVKQAEQTFDTAKQVELYAKAEQLLMNQAVMLPLHNYVDDIIRNPRFVRSSTQETLLDKSQDGVVQCQQRF